MEFSRMDLFMLVLLGIGLCVMLAPLARRQLEQWHEHARHGGHMHLPSL